MVAISLLVGLLGLAGCSATTRIARDHTQAQTALASALESSHEAKATYASGADPRPLIDDVIDYIKDAVMAISDAQEQAPMTEDKNTGIFAAIADFFGWILYAGLIAIGLGIVYIIIRYGWLIPRRKASRVADIVVKAQSSEHDTSHAEMVAALRAHYPLLDSAINKEKSHDD